MTASGAATSAANRSSGNGESRPTVPPPRPPGAGSIGTTVGRLRQDGVKDAHHIIQDAAVRDLRGYDTNAAPGVRLEGPSTQIGTPHYLATLIQRETALAGTYGAERQVAYSSLLAAGISPEEAAAEIARADEYFMATLGVSLDTPVRVPGNRRVL